MPAPIVNPEAARGRRVDLLFSAALAVTALALGPALAHALEAPNKIGLSRENYFVVQQIYRGWNLLAVVLLLEGASMVALAFAVRRNSRALARVLAAIACLVGAQGVFWLFTQPANIATGNWSRAPENWEALRIDREYSHAAGAALQFLAFLALLAASHEYRCRDLSKPAAGR
jgi:hypothetical protein